MKFIWSRTAKAPTPLSQRGDKLCHTYLDISLDVLDFKLFAILSF